MAQMVDAWGGWSLFQVLLQTLNKVASKHGVSIPTVAVRYVLDQVNSIPRIVILVINFKEGKSFYFQINQYIII